jgi:flagellar export protein FliJ
MDPLAVLARLARQAVEEERRTLVRIDRAIDATGEALGELREAAERERRAAGGLADGDFRLLAYLRRMHGRATALETELRRLDNQRQAGAMRLAERHVELRRLELLAGRRAERARIARLRHEQRAIDELVTMRAHRGGG